MKQTEIIRHLKETIKNYAYRATVCEELKNLGIDARMMEYYENNYSGKAFGQMEALMFIADKPCDDIYEEGCDEARKDIENANGDAVQLLNLGGWDGPEYYEMLKKKWQHLLI